MNRSERLSGFIIILLITSLSCVIIVPINLPSRISPTNLPDVIATRTSVSKPRPVRATATELFHNSTVSPAILTDTDLAGLLECGGHGRGDNNCVRHDPIEPISMGKITLISTGIITHINMQFDNRSGIMGDATVLEAMTRDGEQNPVRVYLLLQFEFQSSPEINSYPWTYELVYLIDQDGPPGEVPDSSSLRLDAEWEQLLPRGSQWEFPVSALPYRSSILLPGSVFQTDDYRIQLLCFVESEGRDCSEGLVLAPVGITGIRRYPQ
jgi:hypothetical protein